MARMTLTIMALDRDEDNEDEDDVDDLHGHQVAGHGCQKEAESGYLQLQSRPWLPHFISTHCVYVCTDTHSPLYTIVNIVYENVKTCVANVYAHCTATLV